MEFKNLERNILHVLGEQYARKGASLPYSEDDIFDRFSDLPRESVKTALEDLRRAGLLSAGDVRRHLVITERGWNRLSARKKN